MHWKRLSFYHSHRKRKIKEERERMGKNTTQLHRCNCAIIYTIRYTNITKKEKKNVIYKVYRMKCGKRFRNPEGWTEETENVNVIISK